MGNLIFFPTPPQLLPIMNVLSNTNYLHDKIFAKVHVLGHQLNISWADIVGSQESVSMFPNANS